MHVCVFVWRKEGRGKTSILVNCLSSSIASVAGETKDAANASSIIKVHSSSRLNSYATKIRKLINKSLSENKYPAMPGKINLTMEFFFFLNQLQDIPEITSV